MNPANYSESRATDHALGYVTLRLALGLCIAVHGMVRLSIYGAFIAGTVKQFAPTFLPPASVHLFAATLPWVEAALGILIFLGAATRIALILGALVMLPLLLGMNLIQQWEIVFIQLGYVAIYAYLLSAREWNWWSVDSLFQSRGGKS
jgi:thiosulfate dehydrogenase (quinone) large subunit